MKINVGCGKQTWDGFFCIDAVAHPKATRAPDLLYAFEFEKDGALKAQIPLKDGCADEVHCYHFIEHVHEWEAPAVLAEFWRLLKPNGALVIECPDIAKAAHNLIAGMSDQWCMFPLYGDGSHRDPYMCHKFGYTPKTARTLLTRAKFACIEMKPPQTHGARINRDMRFEARK